MIPPNRQSDAHTQREREKPLSERPHRRSSALLAALIAVSLFLGNASSLALLVGDDGLIEPVIVQIKDSLRTSADLDTELESLAALEKENGLSEVEWYAGPKLLVTLAFPKEFTDDQALKAISVLQASEAVEKVVVESAANLEFRSGDFIRAYEPGEAIPEAALRGLDVDRIGQEADSSDGRPPPVKVDLSQIPHVPNRLIVRWKEEYVWNSGETGFTDQIANFNANASCRVVDEFRYSPEKLTQVLEFDDEKTLLDKLDLYYQSGLAVYVQPDYLYSSLAIPNDRAYDESPGPQWSLPKIKAPEAWDLAKGTQSTILAVADSGGNVSHTDFSTNLATGLKYNFVSNNTNVTDDTMSFHGSNVASIIGAKGNNNAYMTGVVWNTSLMFLKVINSSGSSSSSWIASAINYAWTNGAVATNVSIGGRGPYYTNCRIVEGKQECDGPFLFDPVEFDALRAARDHGMVVVSAAGNDGGTPVANNDNDANYSAVSPASIPTANNISVLASSFADNLASYSSYGLGRVDLGAPGGDSALVNPIIGLKQTFNGNSADSSNYSFLYGTSMAAPHVTGALGLIKGRFPWEDYYGIRDRVLMGTDALSSLTGKCRTNGRLNLYKALQTRTMIRNWSTRARVESAPKIMIGGFTIARIGSGTGTLKVALRGLGPTVGVSVTRLADPKITLYNSSGGMIRQVLGSTRITDIPASEWDELYAAGLIPGNTKEPAMIATLAPGSYTVWVESQTGSAGWGVGLFDLYVLDSGLVEQTRIVNTSTRCLVKTGEEEAIGGTILGSGALGSLPKPNRRLLMFGKGPSLTVTGKLVDPLLDVLNTGETNDDWLMMSLPLREELGEASFLPNQVDESALWPTFAPGAYSVRLRGNNSTTGVGLLELYEY